MVLSSGLKFLQRVEVVLEKICPPVVKAFVGLLEIIYEVLISILSFRLFEEGSIRCLLGYNLSTYLHFIHFGMVANMEH